MNKTTDKIQNGVIFEVLNKNKFRVEHFAADTQTRQATRVASKVSPSESLTPSNLFHGSFKYAHSVGLIV
jgi:hypothetical protein